MVGRGLDSCGSGRDKVVGSCISYVSFCRVVKIAFTRALLEGFQAQNTRSRIF